MEFTEKDEEEDDGKIPLLMIISFRGRLQQFHMSKEYTAFPEEEEVLLQDGIQYKVTKNEEREEPFINKSDRTKFDINTIMNK